ncbi:unnamed protein product [Oreochromis niloticus]|nr:unnamed protein product [Mustela putorius furo]
MRRHHLLPLALLGVLLAGLLPKLDAQEDEVDSSWSMGQENFEHVRHFLYSLIQSLHQVGGERFKFALVQYNSRPHTEFQLNSYKTAQGVLAHIKAMSYRGGGTRTGLGLDFLIHTHLTAASGSRAADGVAQVVVVLTDGRSQDDVAEPAQVLRMAGVEMFAVGVQDAVDWELREMASQPQSTHVFSVDTFPALQSIIQDLVVGLCDAVTQSGGFPVANEAPVAGGGTAQDTADLVLLIDGSQNVGAANFPYVRELVLRIIERLDVGRDTVRVALVLYNSSPEIKFYLNSFYSKSSVLDAVKALTYTGGDESNLGAALEEVAESLLSETSGSRADEGVPQMLVVITAGPSTDDTGAGDRALKRASVITFGMAIGDTATADLETIATDRSFVQSASDVRELTNIGDQLLPLINGVIQRTIIVQNEFTEVIQSKTVGNRDIIFLIDGTMGTAYINSVRAFIREFVESMPIGPDQVQVGIAQFSASPKAEMDLNTHGSKENIISALGTIRPRPGQVVNIGAALNFVRERMLQPEKGSRIQQGVLQLVVLLTSKRSSDSVEEPANALRELGVLTLAAGARAANEQELKQIALGDDAVFYEKDLRTLIRKNKEKMISALSTLAGGVPTTTVTEETIVETTKMVRDIVFLVDGSNYVGSSNLPYVRDFMINTINQLDVSPDRVQIGLLQFADRPKIEFYLSNYRTKEEVVEKISQLRLTGGSALNTEAAMNYTLDNMFHSSRGSRRRQGVQQVLVLITGGPLQDQVKSVADRLALAGVLTFTVSSGQADKALLQDVAFVPDLAFHASSFSGLPGLAEQIMPGLVTVVGATDVTVFQEETVVGAERDVAFLIDGTDRVRADFAYIRDFIIKVIEPLDIGDDKVRISVVQHSERPAASFFLNTYKTKDEVIRAVQGLRVNGGRSLNTGSALRFMKDTILSGSNGGRASQNVPQFLIVLTGDRSTDNVKEPAGALKTDGVVPFGVGVKDADPKQIEAISHNPSFAFNVKEFSELSTIPQRLNNYVSLPREELEVVLQHVELESPQRDIVFLLDGSDNTQSDFPAIRSFVEQIVETLTVDENRDRVSVVQYSGDPQTHFNLNTYIAKQDVLSAIQRLNHKGGISLNTGVALDYVRKNAFAESSGSRHQQGVPQILILLSGGRSQDDVASAAAALKQEKIVPFCVGTRNANILELQMIAHDPSYAFSITQFDDIGRMHDQLVSLLKRVPRQQPRQKSQSPLAPAGQNEPIQRDIVFLLDSSDKMQKTFNAALGFVGRIMETLSVDKNKDRVSVVQYSREPSVDFLLNTYNTKQDVADSLRRLRHKGGEPLNTGAALQYVKDNVLTASSGSRHQDGVPQILILLIGGRSSDDVRNAAENLNEMGVTTFVVGIDHADTLEIQSIAQKSDRAFHAADINNLSDIEQLIISTMKEIKNPAMKPPSHAMRDFVQKQVETLSVDDGKDRVSVVQYSSDPAVQFYLNTYTTKREVLDSVRGLRHKGGRPLNTGAALRYLRDNVFTASAGSRRPEGVPQVLILITGGRSFDSIDEPASALKQLGVLTIAIGTRGSDPRELQTITGEPSHAVSVSDFTDLPNVQEQLSSVMSTVLMRVTPLTPTVTVVRPPAGKDVVFLLDGSDTTRTGFPAMRDFVQKQVETLSMDDGKDRVSVVQYSRDPTVQFYLNTYTTKREVLDSVRGLRHKGGRPLNTGAALRYLRDNVFTASAGSRRPEGVPQVLILITGGRSFDSIDEPASALKQLGVLTIAIGTRGSDSTELQTITGEPSYALSVSELTDLPKVQQQVESSVEAAVIEVTPELPTVIVSRDRKDIVFLLDGSDGTRNGFPAMRDFVERVVEKLSVGENKDHVSVVQYSREPEVHFYLNTYTTGEDVVDSVRGLRHRGGRPLNTGAALQYVRDNVFTNSSGSRRLQGVPQILILLTGGRSFDNVDSPASALKQQGIYVIGIGTRTSDARELQKISYEPSYALPVSEFTDLPSVQEKLSSVMSTVIVRATPMTPTVTVVRPPAGKDVVFLLDGSDATRTGFPAMRDFVQKQVETLSVDDGKDRVSVVQYSSDPAVQFYLNTYTTKREVLDSVRGLRHKGGRPLNTGAALRYLRDNVFTASAGSRRPEGVPQVLILITGGRSFDSIDEPASALKQLGVLTIAIGTRGSDPRELQTITGEPSHAVSVSDFTDLPNVQEQLSSVMSTVLMRVTPLTPTVTVVRPPAGKDVVFLLDGSDATRTGFPAMRDFVQKQVETLSVDDGKDRVSVVQYSSDAAVQFYLNTYTTKREVLDSVRGLRHKGGRPLNTGAALRYLRDNVFTASAGSRRPEGVPQVLILITGGRSFDSIDEPASALKQLGVLTIAIGTRGSDSTELQTITGEPSYALSVSELTDLPKVQQQVESSVEAAVIEVTPELPTVIVSRDRKDIVFLLDGSDGTRNGFPAMRDFVERVVEKLNVGENKDHVSVVQYSREPEVHFYLNTYTTGEDVVDSVRGLRHRGGRPLNTGAALQYVRDNVFTNSSGSRRLQGVPQILILLTGGRSFDNVDSPASALKQQGIYVIGIGTRTSDARELQKISYEPSYALPVSEFTDLPSVQEKLSSVMSTVIVRATPMTPTVTVVRPPAGKDVVFLLDGSDTTRTGFPAMRDFVQKQVETLSVDDGKDRVSVVQYSRDPAVQFYLNTYTTTREVLDSVRGLRHKGGRPLNTGAALRYLRDNVFTASAGSRRPEGVPQVLILITGGRSFDSIDEPASALKQLGVLTIAIGTRGSDPRELQTITGEPSHAVSVSDFTDLPNVQEQLSSVMSTVLMRVTPLTPTVTVVRQPAGKDVVFLLDGSDATRTGFPAMRDFVQKQVETLSVDDGKDRVSVVQYSSDPAVQFYLNTYTTKREVLDSVRGLRHKGGRPLNTGAALRYLRDNVFTASAGSRRPEGVPQVLILITGGRSFDSIDEPASALKQLGVLTIAIGTRGSDSTELQTITGEPSYALSVSELTDLPKVQQQVESSVEAAVIEVTPELPTVIVSRDRKDIVFLLDGSDGTRNGFPAMRDFVERVVEKLSVGENKDHVSVVQYSREPEVHFYLNTYTTGEDVVDSVRGLRHRGGRPLNTGAALQYVRDNVFTNSSGSRRLQGVPQILILLTGGRSFDNVDSPASALKQQGIYVIGIGTRTSDARELQKISYEPSYALPVSEFTDLPSVQEKLSSVMSTVIVRATPMTPTVTVVRPPAGKDVVFLLDGSDTTRTGFPAMRDFVQKQVETLSVDDGKDRVSVVQYSSDPAVQFYLNTYTTKREVLDSVRGLRHKGGRPLNTGAALRYLRDNVFTASAGSRRPEGVPQVLILITGGRSFDSIDEPASALKQLGVLTIAIGTRGSDSTELQTITGEPSYALSVSELTDLPKVQQQVESSVEAAVIEVTPELPTVIVSRDRKDIVFLLDGSDGTRNGFPAMRDFVERVVEKLSVGENKDHVSVVQYSREPEVHFYLNTYTTGEDVVDSVRGLRHRGGRPLNTGAALQYVRDNVFTNSSGSRRLQGVPQILILLTGGRSFDNVDSPASALKQQGIYVIGIGTRTSDARELQKISYEPSYALSVSEFTDLPSVQEKLSSVMSTVIVRATPMTPTVTVVRPPAGKDVVFLLDGSDTTRTGFPAMRDFVQKQVETLSVDDGKDRVSVVQYSRDPAVQFYLNTYTTKREVLDSVRGLRHKGGRPLNTGAALRYLRDNVFTASAGSRRPEGVPQVLILITGGRSFDSIDEPASALKQLGVLTIGIGTRGSDPRELQTITGKPSHAVSVSDFTDLPNVQEQLSSVMSTVLMRVTPLTPTVTVVRPPAGKDVVFLLDGSDATRTGFPAMRDFVQKQVETLSVDDGKDRVSVVQYSSDAAVQFYLNTYTTKREVLDSVRGLRHKGGRPLNTGAALRYLRDNVFTASAGSRRPEGVPQVLILITGGRSFDSIDEPASALKQLGVLTIAIGTRGSDSTELQTITGEPSYALSVSELTDLPKVQQQVESSVEAAVIEVTPELPTVIVSRDRKDIVFLLDGSDGTRNGFPAMRDFVERVVEKLNVGENKDHVSVVQYSREPEVHFYLNTYTTGEDVVDSVRGLRHRGGRPLNTGAALQYVRDNVFTNSSGSRRLQGVPQILILLTGGRSFDNVDSPASALKQQGIYVIGIGTRTSDARELQKISYEPSYALPVSEFTDLPSVQEKLSSVMSTVIVRATPMTPTVTVVRPPAGKDVVFLLDGSDTTRTGFPAMRDFVQKQVETLSVDDGKDRVSVVQYSRDPAVQFYLNTYTTTREVLDSVRGLRHKGGRPLNTGAALRYLRDNVFTASAGSRRPEGVPQVLILITGGRSFDSIDEPASALKQLGVLTIGIGTRGSDPRELQTITGKPSHAVSVSDFTDLPNVQEQLSSVMSTVLMRVTPLTPTVTVVRPPAGKDVVFLLDGSDATRTGFPAMRDFVQKQVETLSVDDGKDRVSVVQYSSDAAVQFYLNTYTTKREVLDSVRGLRHKGGRPLNTGAALRYLRDNVFTASAGSRRPEGVPQVLILITGGRSFDSIDEPASALKQLGVLTIAIGTRGSDSTELQTITGEPSYALSVSELTDLPKVQQQVESSVEAAVIEVTPELPTVIVSRDRKDIVFLLDGSDGTRNGFPAMRDFVERVVEKLNVGENKDHVSVVQYSREPEVHFYLNTYTTGEDVVDSVRGLRHRGGRPLNTGAALQYVRDNVFTNSSGSRRLQGVPQILILLTGGRSFDNVDSPASALKQQGIYVIGIGTRTSDARELQKISYEPSYALPVSEFTDLPSVQEKLSSVMSTVIVRATPMTPTVTVVRPPAGKDVVFLLDGSDTTRTGFPAMRDFVQKQVETLSVDDGKDRVSVVQYSSDPAVQFYLNTYTTKREVLDSVRGLRHKGGRPLNTGAALRYLRDNVFTASAGSRRPEGVPQVLILITGGRSFDSIDEPASALKQLGVLTIAIGTRGSDPRELQTITGEPSHAVSVSDFTDLPNVQEQLSSVMSTVLMRVTPLTPTVTVVRQPAGKDVVFLLDGSDATRTGFPAMRDFVQKQVETLSVDDGKDRVSVVQYSSDPAVQFYLNTYTTKREVLDSVRGLRHKGGRPLNTGAALRYLRDNVFTASAGSRRPEGVPQVLILITGGRSFDSIDEPASALKQLGVLTIAIGTRGSDSTELQTITGEPSYALSVSELTDLPKVQQQVESSVEAAVIEVTPELPTVIVSRDRKDIVFLLDGSDGTRNGFPAMRDFVERVVEKLNVGENKDHVSVVQYSREPEVHFYLNTYTTGEDVVDSVRGLRHRGGRPLNTGAALQYVRDNVFTNSSGSRRLQGVPQILILLTGGRSFDNVDSPASALKQQGIYVIGIGTRTSDARELQKISYEPSYALPVSEFTDLPSVQEKLSSVMSTVIVRATPMTPTVTGKNVTHL